MLVHRRVTNSTEFASTHLYTWLERGTVRVKCLIQEHNAVSQARAHTLFWARHFPLAVPLSTQVYEWY